MMQRIFFVLAIVAASARFAAADDGLSKARDLYAAAEYENALAVLNDIKVSDQQPDQARAVEQYRASCYLALGRKDDAEHAIEAIVEAEPSYKVSDADLSPRVRSAFADVRRRMLPSIIQERYAAAKSAFDRKDAGAATAFEQVLVLLADPDIANAASQPPLSDLRTLAAGFRDLAVKAAEPPPAPLPAAPPPQAQPIVAPAVQMPERGKIYTMDDPGVTPPVAVRQNLPPFQMQTQLALGQGVLEIVVGENGSVVAAVMKASVFPHYDAMVVEAARSWKFKPATMNGVPVLYRKTVKITVQR